MSVVRPPLTGGANCGARSALHSATATAIQRTVPRPRPPPAVDSAARARANESFSGAPLFIAAAAPLSSLQSAPICAHCVLWRRGTGSDAAAPPAHTASGRPAPPPPAANENIPINHRKILGGRQRGAARAPRPPTGRLPSQSRVAGRRSGATDTYEAVRPRSPLIVIMLSLSDGRPGREQGVPARPAPSPHRAPRSRQINPTGNHARKCGRHRERRAELMRPAPARVD